MAKKKNDETSVISIYVEPVPRLALSPAELAQSIGVSEPKAYELVRQEGFPSFRLNGRWLVSIADLKIWLSEQVAQKRETAS